MPSKLPSIKEIFGGLKNNFQTKVAPLGNAYNKYRSSPFIQNYDRKVNQPIYDLLNKGANIPRFQFSRELVGRAIPQTKTPVGRTVTDIALGIPESILNIPRNLTVGYSRLQKENLGAIRQASMGQKITPNWQNIITGVAPLAEAGLDIASFGTASTIAKQGGKQLLKGGVKQAFKQGAKQGALYGSAGGLTYGVGEQYGKKFNAGEVTGSTLMGASLGGLLGGGISSIGAIKKLIQYSPDVLNQLRDSHGRWLPGRAIVKPPKMPQAQWDFQIKFNKKWNRNPYEPVFPSDLEQVLKIEAERNTPALQVRDINKDKIRGTLPNVSKAGLYDTGNFRKQYPDSTSNPLYDQMMKARQDLSAKTKEISPKVKSDAEIPPKLLSELNTLKTKMESTAKAWEDVYVNKMDVGAGMTPEQARANFQKSWDTTYGTNLSGKNVAQPPSGEVTLPNTKFKLADVQEQITRPQTSLEGQIVPQKSTVLENVGQPQTKIPSGKPLIETQKPVTGQKKLISSDLSNQAVADGSYKFNVADRLYTESVNRFHPLSKLAKVADKDNELNRKIAGFYGTGSTADYHLSYELSPILKKQNPEDLRSAMVAMRDIELANRKIKGSPLQKEAPKILEELRMKYGDDGMKKLGDSLKELYAYQDKIAKQYLVDKEIMSQESYNKMRMDNNFYVPFKRVTDEVDTFLGIPVKKGAGSVGSQNVIYKIKGSNKEIVDPIQSIVENTYKMVSLGKRQEIAQTIAGLSKELPELVYKTNKTGMKDTISVFENGKKVNYVVPPEVAEAARGMGEESLVTLVKILKIPTDLFRTMTTGINPEFLLPNVSRDVQSAIFNTGVNPLKWVAGLAHYAKKDAVFQDFLKSGAKTSRVSLNRPFIEQTAQELSGKGFRIKTPNDIIRGLEMLSQFSEQPTRLMVFQDAYKTAIKKGLSVEDALGEAAYWAQEGTVNFARRGSKTPNINAIYAYLNARIQGIDRMMRTVKKEPGKAAVRYAIAFLTPSLALYAWNSKNPDYYDERILSKRDKRDNFIFMLPKPVGEVRYLKIPKAEVGKVVNPVEEFLDMARGKGGDIWSSIGSVLKSFSPIDNWGGVIPTAITPLVETAFNKDFYTGYDIVPEYKKNYPAGYQDSSYTGPMYRFAGQKLNVSPAKLQNVVEGYGGGALRMVDYVAGKVLPDKYTSAKNEQGADINRTPVLRRFLGGEKKSEEEQIKANASRINAINFDINDIKAGVKRGDIPMDVGAKKIEELQKQQKDLSSSTIIPSNTEIVSGQNLQWIQSADGSLKQIDLNFTVPELTLTGNTALDKELKRDYAGKITSLKNDVMTAFEAGRITEEEAIKQLEKLNNAANKTKSAKKLTLPKLTVPKMTPTKYKSTLGGFKLSDIKIPDIQNQGLNLSKSSYTLRATPRIKIPARLQSK